MAIYEYVAEDGVRIQIEASMRTPPPEVVRRDGRDYRRDWSSSSRVGVVVRRGAAINHKGQTIPVSRSLPVCREPGEVVTMYGHSVRKHRDGTYTTLDGSRIIDSGSARDRQLAATGYVSEDHT